MSNSQTHKSCRHYISMKAHEWMVMILAIVLAKARTTMEMTAPSGSQCGGLLTLPHGVIQTPNFPNAFTVPITCVWIIDTSELRNASIIVYLTQQYVLSGLTFTEYMYYSEDYKVPSGSMFELHEDDATKVPWVKFSSPYLEIKFTMTSLYGTHLRALDRLLDVYGFNITYEVDSVKPYQCNALQCRFLGHCYATHDFSSYYCACFPGFSGPDCGIGPLCKNSKFCENGGVCKHIGDSAITCLCPPGFKGNKCDIPEYEDISGCSPDGTEECTNQCFHISNVNTCKCSQSFVLSNRGRARFEATIQLGNTTSMPYSLAPTSPLSTSSLMVPLQSNDEKDKRANVNLSTLLEKHITRYLKNFNITKFNDVEILPKMSSGSDITFQFFGAKNDGAKIRELLNRMVERGRLGNYTLVPNFLLFKQEPGLMLQSVVLNQRTPIREEAEFILSCVAQGSQRMTFRWYKNGVFINGTRATRSMWTRLLPLDSKDHYTALLGISKATSLDEGTYTCQVSDWGIQQCRSIKVQILEAPQLRVNPPSATLFRGESLTLRCLSQISDHRYGTLGYSWTKNDALFQSDPNVEMWEDLYPDGSILRIKNIQKSAVYSCVVSNSVTPVSKDVHVTVVERDSVTLCPPDRAYGVEWPASAAGPPVLADCPNLAEGQAQRVCEQKSAVKTEWLQPDFSNCASGRMMEIHNNFRELTFGYQKTNATTVLQACLEYAMRHKSNFLPGEGGFLLTLLQEVVDYLELVRNKREQEIASDIILKVVDILMQNRNSLNNQQHLKQLQTLVQHIAVKNEHSTKIARVSSSSSSSSGAASASSPSLSSLSEASTAAAHSLSSFYVYSESVKSLPYELQIHGDYLFSDQLYMQMDITNSLLDIISNGTVLVTVISYKNLTSFLPRIYFARNSFGTDVDFIPASRVISSWLYYANRTKHQSKELKLSMESAHVEIMFQHECSPTSEWVPVCGFDARATFEPTWRTDLCITENLMENITRCICPLSGTFVVLLARKNYNTSMPRATTKPVFVLISCSCCFLQSFFAFVVLVPTLYHRKCCVTFLKMQFCTTTSTSMAIFLLGLLKLLPQDWHGLISSTLAAVLLLSSSTLVAILLIVQSELGPKRIQFEAHLRSGLRIAVGVSWLLPILSALCIQLVHNILGKAPLEWWLEWQSFGFTLFVIIDSLFVILFIVLFTILIRKLLYLAKKHDKYNASILRRIGLLYRTLALFVTNLLSHSIYLIYVNTDASAVGYMFGVSCILLGFTIICCYVIKSESKLDSETTSNKSSAKLSLDGNFCSGSINSPLSFFTNQDGEKDNESIPSGGSGATTKIPLQVLTRSHGSVSSTGRNTVDTFLGSGHDMASGSRHCDLSMGSSSFNSNKQQHHYELACSGTAGNLPSTSAVAVDGANCQHHHHHHHHVCHHLHQGQQQQSQSQPHQMKPIVHEYKMATTKCYLKEAAGEDLQLLQGLSQDISCSSSSIIGIRSKLHETNQPNVVVVAPIPPTIIVTPDDDSSNEGMLDRISHDLDFLLNRTSDNSEVAAIRPSVNLPTVVPAPPSFSCSSLGLSSKGNLMSSSIGHTVHEVILEEAEEIDS